MDPVAALLGTGLNATALVAPGLAGRAALEVFKRPLRRSRLRAEEQELRAEAATEDLAVHGKRVVTYRWGDGGRPVLLVHGWQSRASRFAAFVPGLRALGLSPVAFDAPGHGESGGSATTILEYREVIGALHRRYGDFEAVVAHSFGVTAAFLALRNGVRAERVVAVAGVVDFDVLPASFSAQLGLGARAERALNRRLDRVLLAGTPGLRADRDLRRHFDASYRPDGAGAADPGPAVLAVYDEDDAVVGLDQAHRLREAYGDRLDLVVTRGLGHRRILADPAVVDHAIGFLGEPRASREPGAPRPAERPRAAVAR
ncbi:alpha/beta fold hydrolase [Kitasatospora sp. NPDC054939]